MGAWELTDGVSKADVLLSGRGQTDICDTCDAKGCEGTPFRDHLAEGGGGGGEGVWHKASVSDCLPLAAPIGLSPPLILTICGSERVLVVSTEPPDDVSCLTTPGVGRPGDGPLPVPLTGCIQMHPPRGGRGGCGFGVHIPS